MQGDKKDWKMAVKNPVCKGKELIHKEVASRNSIYGKELVSQEKSTKEKFHILNQSRASDFLDQSEAPNATSQSETSKHRQTWSPSWTCVHLDLDMLPVHSTDNILTNTANSKLEMDNNQAKEAADIEEILNELIKDPPVEEGQLKTPTK